MTSEFNTPMMKQYLGIKRKYQDCLLFYRMGDFYELFLDDAHIGAKVLGITLTSRSKGKDGRIPMAGVPYHAVDTYLYKLVKNGYKVAICEQLSEPNKKGIVDRDVIRIVTPGTIVSESALEKKQNNYLIAICRSRNGVGISYADVSTGECLTHEKVTDNIEEYLADQLNRLQPAECLVTMSDYEDPQFIKFLRKQSAMSITPIMQWETRNTFVQQKLCAFFHVTTLLSFAIEDKPLSQQSTLALVEYLSETQKGNIGHITGVKLVLDADALHLDRSTIINLELFSTIREHDTSGSLLNIIDETQTAMGGRLLKQWICSPLCNYDEINKRHEAVAELVNERKLRSDLTSQLSSITDIERILSRLSVGIGNARDLVALQKSLEIVGTIHKRLANVESLLLQSLRQAIDPQIGNVCELIARTIKENPSITLKDGGIIREGVDEHLDELRNFIHSGDVWLREYEDQERKSTSISSLKVRYNSVFGYYIDVTKSNIDLVPRHYSRKQTLVSSERYSTDVLKDHESKMLTALEESNRMEYEIYTRTLQEVLSFTEAIQRTANTIAILDIQVNFATLAEKYSYTRPKLLYSNELMIQDGRHPVVERILSDEPFVPNSVHLDPLKDQLLIVTGPNMAGKSVFIRQVALIVLLCQIGSFVPARSSHIGIVDSIFVRSGASDVITAGLSTFMVEMVETAHILRHATKKSLVIMDEIGRGTSTYDGISIAWAVATHLVTTVQAKTLFATHYHELQALEELHPSRIHNYHMAVVEDPKGPSFLHTLLPGGATSSFGIEVAKLAGIPAPVITSAQEKLTMLEQRDHTLATQPTITHDVSALEKELLSLNISQLTPLEALNFIAKIQQEHRQ